MNIIKSIPLVLFIIIATSSSVFSQKQYSLLYLEGKNDKIVSIAQNKIKYNNVSVDDYYWLAYSLHETGKQVQSLSYLKCGVEIFPKSDRLKKLLADYYYELGDYYNAQSLYLDYVNEIQYAFKLCEIYEANTEFPKVVKLLTPIFNRDTMNLVCVKHLALSYFRLQDFKNAELFYKRALAISPYDQYSAKKLVGIYNNSGRHLDAIKVCNVILKHDSENVAFLKLAGYTALKQENYYRCSKLFYKVYAKGDSSAYVLKHLGISELKRDKFIKGQKLLHLAYAKDSTDYLVCYFLGESYLHNGVKKRGLIFLEKSMKNIQPKVKVVCAINHQKANLYKSLKDYESAIKMYIDSYKVSNNPVELFYVAGVYNTKLKNLRMALDYYKLFVKKVEGEKSDEDEVDAREGVSASLSLTDIAKRHISDIKKELFFRETK